VFRRLFVVLALLAFVMVAAVPILSAQAYDPLPKVGDCIRRGWLWQDGHQSRLVCTAEVVIPRMWAVGATNPDGDLSPRWCALISEQRPGVDIASDICFENAWRFNTVICYGPVYSDNTWDCDEAVGGADHRMAVENLIPVYERHLERIADLSN
jgi:hypothetical protein